MEFLSPIDMAIGILMVREGLDAEGAFVHLLGLADAEGGTAEHVADVLVNKASNSSRADEAS